MPGRSPLALPAPARWRPARRRTGGRWRPLPPGSRPEPAATQRAGAVGAVGAAGERRDVALWCGLAALGALVTAAVVATGVRLGTDAAPFLGRYGPAVGPRSVLAPALAAVVLATVRAGWHERLPWRLLLAVAWAAALGWALALAAVDGTGGLAGGLTGAHGALTEAGTVGSDPLGYLRHVAGQPGRSAATAGWPPVPVLALWASTRLGLRDPAAIGALLAAVGALTVPLVAVAVRSLCHEPAARALLPVLALAPYGLWLAGSPGTLAAAIAAGGLACAVLAGERGRSGRAATGWALAAGLLLGVAALCSYAAPWLAAAVLAVHFVRRRAWLTVASGAALLVPVLLAWLAGFAWPDGLVAARADAGPPGSGPAWVLLDLVVLVAALGPAGVAAARKVRRTPGWPFLVGAALAVVATVLGGLGRAGVEHGLLAFLPWLLVPAVAPQRRPPVPGSPAAAPTPLLATGLGAAAAVVLAAVLHTGG